MSIVTKTSSNGYGTTKFLSPPLTSWAAAKRRSVFIIYCIPSPLHKLLVGSRAGVQCWLVGLAWSGLVWEVFVGIEKLSHHTIMARLDQHWHCVQLTYVVCALRMHSEGLTISFATIPSHPIIHYYSSLAERTLCQISFFYLEIICLTAFFFIICIQFFWEWMVVGAIAGQGSVCVIGWIVVSLT